MRINCITVLGANGIMGANISAIFGAFGNAKVYMVARNIHNAQEAKKRACASIRCEKLESLLICKTYADIEECIFESDAVFESVSEDLKTKREVYSSIGRFLTADKYILNP